MQKQNTCSPAPGPSELTPSPYMLQESKLRMGKQCHCSIKPTCIPGLYWTNLHLDSEYDPQTQPLVSPRGLVSVIEMGQSDPQDSRPTWVFRFLGYPFLGWKGNQKEHHLFGFSFKKKGRAKIVWYESLRSNRAPSPSAGLKLLEGALQRVDHLRLVGMPLRLPKRGERRTASLKKMTRLPRPGGGDTKKKSSSTCLDP